MGDGYRTIRLAAVQAAPVFLDREGSVAKACRLIREAGAGGAQLVGFPEGFIPTHPLWFHFHPATGRRCREFGRQLFCNAVEIPGPATEDLCLAAREARIYVVMGLCEKIPGRMGTMYNTLLFLDDHGNILGRHRKLRPTQAERVVHAPGDAEGLRTYPAEFGAFSGLMCGENSNPLSIFTLDAQGTVVHVASWPSHFSLGNPMAETIEVASRALAYQTKSFVLNAVGAVSERMRELLPLSDEDREFLVLHHAGASVVGPRGKFVAGPMGSGEGILYADVRLGDVIIPKIIQDFSGHYNRFDVYRLSVKSANCAPLRVLGGEAEDRREEKFLGESSADGKLSGPGPFFLSGD